MNRTITAGPRTGQVAIPASKSYAHRLLICAALSGSECRLACDGISRDIQATADCLRGLGASVDIRPDGTIIICPTDACNGCASEGHTGHMIGTEDRAADDTNMIREICELNCGESGSTLRFLLPIAAALGRASAFIMAEGLARRPMDELVKVLSTHGVKIVKQGVRLTCEGQLTPGEFSIPGNVSSQYISGLLFALPLLGGDSVLKVTGDIESRAYITMTEETIRSAGIVFDKKDDVYYISGNQRYHLAETAKVEQDWSNAAFFLCMGALSEQGITIGELPLESSQGDREILEILRGFGADIVTEGSAVTVRRKCLTGQTVDASAIPDLVPTVSALAACAEGTTRIVNAGRLRIKESDRLSTTFAMLAALGADITELPDGLVIHGKKSLAGGTVDAANDHRIAMAAAVAACACESEVVVLGAECVAKSYPDFWKHFDALRREA